MSRSRARKNRFKYKTLRRIGFFKVIVMNYPNSNGNIYPSLNFGTSKYSKKFIRELQHPQGSFFSISSHIDEGYSNVWDVGLKHAQEAEANGELFYPTIKQQDSSAMEHSLDMICKIMGVSRDNLKINPPALFATSVEESVDYAVKLGQPITKPQEPSNTDFLSPWPTKLDLAGVWSNPVDVSPMPGHSFEEVKTEKMLNLARALKKSNAREYLKKAADILGEDIEVDDIFLGDGLKMFRVREDMWNMDEVKEDSPEWAVVMIAFCRHPELAQQLRAYGSTITEVRRSTLNDSSPAVISDVYHLFDTTNIKVAEAFKPIPFSVPHEEHIGELIIGFTAKMLDTTRSGWTPPDDK